MLFYSASKNRSGTSSFTGLYSIGCDEILQVSARGPRIEDLAARVLWNHHDIAESRVLKHLPDGLHMFRTGNAARQHPEVLFDFVRERRGGDDIGYREVSPNAEYP